MTEGEFLDIQQPLDKDGYTNDIFDKEYGKKKNPYTGTERERKSGKTRHSTTVSFGKIPWLK